MGHNRIGTIGSGTNGHTAAVQHRAQVEVVNTLDIERHDATLLRSRAIDPQPLHLAKLLGGIVEQRPLVGHNARPIQASKEANSLGQADSVDIVGRARLEFQRQVGIGGLLEGHLLDHIATAQETKTIKGTDKLSIVAEHLDSNGNKWGKLSTGGWINVSAGIDNTPVVEDPESVIDPITVTVTTSGVNNRTGPGTNYAKQGKFDKGQQLVLTAVQKGGIYKWGKSEYGWIALQYTDYDSVILQGSEDAKKVTAVGTIIKADVLNVRSGPGVHNSKVDVYYRNDSVKITLRQKVGNTTWGLTEKGWISLYYVKLTEVKDGEVPDIDISGGSGDSTTTPGGSTGTGTGTGSNGTTVIATGKIINCNSVRIRAGAGTNTACIGSYANGTYVSFYETVKLKSDVWGRTDKGWVCLRYVALDAPTTGEGVTGRIINCTNLNVRAAAGTAYAKVAKLSKGTKVEILEYVKVGNAIWGRISQGWIHLYYVKLDAPLTNLDKKDEVDTETDVNTGTGTGESTGTGSGESTGTGSGESTGTGSGESTGTGSGESTGTGSGESTGTGSDEGTDDKEDKTPGADVDTSIEVTFKGTITADPSMKIRAAAGTQYGEVGTYKKGNRVTILEITAVGKSTWGRTDKGWISLFYVKPDGDTNVEGVVVKTITASSLKIRKEPASNAEVVGSYYTNNLVVVFLQIQNTETKEVWGLTENGWINMKYTK